MIWACVGARGDHLIPQLNLLCLLAGLLTFGIQVLLNRFLSSLLGSAVMVQLTLLFSFFLFYALGSALDRKKQKDLVFASLGLFILTVFLYLSFGSFWLEVLPRHEWRLFFALLVVAPFALCVAFFLPSFAALYQGGFKGAYFSFHIGAVLGLIGIEFVILPWIGVKKTLLILSLISFSFFVKFFRGLRSNVQPLQTETIVNKVMTQKYGELFLYSFLSGIVSFTILRSMNYFFGPFSQNFVLITLISLGSLSVASCFKLSFTTWKTWIPHLLSFAFLSLGVWLNFMPTLYEFLVVEHTLSRNFVVLVLMLVLYGPIYFSFGLLLPSFSDETKGAVGPMLGLNSLGNALGLFFFYTVGDLLPNPVLVLSAVTIICLLISLSFHRHLGALMVLFALGVFFMTTNADLFSYSFRYFQSADSFRYAKENLVRIEKFRSLGSEVAIHHFRDKSETLVIDGYRSISIHENSNHFESEALLGFLHSLVLPKNEKTLVLGVGSGATVVAAAKTGQRVTAVEINPAVFKFQSRFNDFNRGLLDLDNLELILDDGYSHLINSTDKYDLILNNVPTPQYSVASSIWTREFLLQVKSRLTQRGVYAQWLNGNMSVETIKIMLATLQTSFESCALAVLGSKYFNLICSDSSLEITTDQKILQSLAVNLGLKNDFEPLSKLVILLEQFQDLDFGNEINTLEHPLLVTKMDYHLDRAWNQNGEWFYFDLFDLNQNQKEKICASVPKLQALLDYKKRPDFCLEID